MRADPTTSPIITRRTGLSVAQPTPLMKLVDGEMPDLEHVQVRERGKHQGVDQHHHDDQDKRGAPFHAVGERAEEGAEQAHRQQAQHRHHCDDERRFGALVDEHADRDRLHPAHREHDEPDEPEAPEVGVVDQPGRAAGPAGHARFMHGKDDPRRAGGIMPLLGAILTLAHRCCNRVQRSSAIVAVRSLVDDAAAGDVRWIGTRRLLSCAG